MEKFTVKIEGMMCGMCEAHIADTIRTAFPEAGKVKASVLTRQSSKRPWRTRAIHSFRYLRSRIKSAGCSGGKINMKPDYKNWMPKGMVLTGVGATALLLVLFIVFGLTGLVSGTAKTVLFIVFLALTLIALAVTVWMYLLYRAFSYNGKRQLSKQIIDGVAEYVKLPQGGRGLDVGCGSGALTIACAKRNPQAHFVGIDRWGKEYASYNKPLCESNAKAEGVRNVAFMRGDAVKLDFPDESFDAVTSNYVYHNIPGDKQKYLLETLRVLKKGGTFAIHDIFSKSRYGDMQAFVKKLKAMGYEKAELIPTDNDRFIKKGEAAWTELAGSAILTGRK